MGETMKAFITGITGQDGYYLSKHLLDLDYEVMEQLGDPQLLTHRE